jgi:hypothetical protein
MAADIVRRLVGTKRHCSPADENGAADQDEPRCYNQPNVSNPNSAAMHNPVCVQRNPGPTFALRIDWLACFRSSSSQARASERTLPSPQSRGRSRRRQAKRANWSGVAHKPSAWRINSTGCGRVESDFPIKTKTHFSLRTDIWDDAGGNIVEHVVGVDDFEVAEATYRAPVACWPAARIGVRQSTRIVHESFEQR